VRASSRLSPLLGCRTDKLRRNERQPEGRLSLPSVELLACSCSQPPWLSGSFLTHDARRIARRLAKRLALCVFSPVQPRLDYSLYKYAATLELD
jgi:hypothetical protein